MGVELERVPYAEASVPLNLDPSTPSHYVALQLLGADVSRVVPPYTNRSHSAFQSADYTQGVALATNALLDLLYVENLNCCYRPTAPHLFERFEDYEIKRAIKKLWQRNIKILGSMDTKKLKECVEMTKEMTPHYQEDLNRRYISITSTLFWDSETASLTDSPELPVFFRLFDTSSPNDHFVKIPPFTPKQVKTLHNEYQKSLTYLNSHNGDLPEDYSFITLWADYNHDVYMDIMRLMASPFMRKKPFGAYMLVGLKRNGKTAVSNDFMKTLLGTNNCSSITLNLLGDHHHNSALQWTLWNAPDEEDEKPTQYAAIFKTMADHGEVKVTKLYSQTPITVDCDFMCAFPMNHHPVWTGSGAAACVERSRIIEFTHRFEQDDNPTSFAERTFTADLFCHILGPILALATYHLTHPMIWSETMKMQQHSLEGEIDSHTIYLDHFIAFFDGFTSLKIIYEDYKLWCSAHDLNVSSFPAFKLAFGAFTNGGQKSLRVNNQSYKGYRVRQQGKKPLVPDQTYEVMYHRLGPLSVYQDEREALHYSIVERAEAVLDEKLGDKAEEQLNKLILAAREVMANRPAPEIPPEPEQQPLVFEDDPFKE